MVEGQTEIIKMYQDTFILGWTMKSPYDLDSQKVYRIQWQTW